MIHDFKLKDKNIISNVISIINDKIHLYMMLTMNLLISITRQKLKEFRNLNLTQFE